MPFAWSITTENNSLHLTNASFKLAFVLQEGFR